MNAYMFLQFQRIHILLFVPLMLLGCAKTVAVDSPRPHMDTRDCSGLLTHPGDQCFALIRSDQYFSNTNLSVKKGQRYRIIVPNDQFWYDSDRRSAPPYGDTGNFFMNLFAFLKRDDAPWFTLMAVVTNDDMSQRLGPAYELTHGDIQIEANGLLTMYPNDARLPYFYQNNHGQIWVNIRRLSGN